MAATKLSFEQGVGATDGKGVVKQEEQWRPA